MHTGYIALGGNIGDPQKQIADALKRLRNLPIIEAVVSSPFYRTAAVGGPGEQPDYLNAVAQVRTDGSPHELLDACLRIERELGRVRDIRWGPRTIDLDLLLYDDWVVASGSCRIPHPSLENRLFVLVPLLDIAGPDLKIPPEGTALIDMVSAALGDDGEDLNGYRKKRI